MASVEEDEALYVVPQNRNFVWPTIEIGRKVTIPHVKTPQGEPFCLCWCVASRRIAVCPPPASTCWAVVDPICRGRGCP